MLNFYHLNTQRHIDVYIVIMKRKGPVTVSGLLGDLMVEDAPLEGLCIPSSADERQEGTRAFWRQQGRMRRMCLQQLGAMAAEGSSLGG